MSTWKKGITKSGTIPTKAFSAILTAIYPGEIKNGTKALMLDFDNGVNIAIFGTGKAKITDEGVEVSGSLAQFQESLEALKYVCQWGVEGSEIIGFQTVPDIVGSKLYMKPLEEQTVGDDTQTKKSVFWGTVEKVEKVAVLQASAPASASQRQPALVANDGNLEALIVAAIQKGASNISDIYIALGRKYVPGILHVTIDKLKKQGMIVEDGNRLVA